MQAALAGAQMTKLTNEARHIAQDINLKRPEELIKDTGVKLLNKVKAKVDAVIDDPNSAWDSFKQFFKRGADRSKARRLKKAKDSNLMREGEPDTY